uniref:Chemotaxis phosphatase CheX-like domain-containing protein n=1 Tax=Desulfovibrio sp. U5L TaxID=596152 RepID=I2Q6M5_9BACT
MFSQFFGNYLRKRGCITFEQMREVLALQDSVRVKLGVLAIDAGYMSAAQVEEVHSLQSRIDKRFGEIAIDMGILDEEKLSVLLGQQNKRHLFISQALIDKGIMTFEDFEGYLEDYKKDSGLSAKEFEALKTNDIDTITQALLHMPELGESDMYVEYFALFVRNLVRFIDDHILLEEARKVQLEEFDCLIHQEIDGRYKFFTGFAGTERSMAEFATRFAKMAVAGMDEVARDSLGEFMNVHNGLYLSKLSNEWVELELLPPEYKKSGSLKSVGVAYKIPFALSFGQFDFFIGVGSPVFNHR